MNLIVITGEQEPIILHNNFALYHSQRKNAPR